MAEPIRTSDIIFPALSTNLSSTLAELRRSTLNISNRLRSISEDAEFVCAVADAYGLPLIANERCGGWYIPPERKAGSAYFKSTDGHSGQWAFSLRRLNFQILDILDSNQGCIIVDSTRRGKRMPDALSKTIPIWCAVLNKALFPDVKSTNSLHTPPQSVSASEHAQIEEKLQEFADQFKSLRLDAATLRQKLSKPLRPIWVTRDSFLPTERLIFPDFHPVILCTASRLVRGAEMSEAGYIQGAGDDNEGWSQGLDPSIFWSNKEQLLSATEEDLPDVIEQLLSRHQHAHESILPTVIAPSDWLFVASSSALKDNSMGQFAHIIFCGKAFDRVIDPQYAANCLRLDCREGKLGSRDLRKELTKVIEFLVSRMPIERVLVSCHDGKDISIGVALALLCLFADEDGRPLESIHESAWMGKDFIKRRLSWIMTSLPSAKPSRTTLQSVNDFLLTSPQQGKGVPLHRLLERKSLFHDPAEEIFTGLTGKWQMARGIANSLQAGLANDVNDFAVFESRKPVSEESKAEYLYSESGEFTTMPGAKLNVKRRWLWRLSKQGSISVHFVKSDGECEDYSYYVLSFDETPAQTPGKDGEHVLVAHGDHICGEDHHKIAYEFFLQSSKGESRLTKFVVRHVVKGPENDYVSETWHHRGTKDAVM